MLDIDAGTYPFVTSSNTGADGDRRRRGLPAAASSTASIGIAKAYCTRVGEGPFPTEAPTEVGDAHPRGRATSTARPRAGRGAAAGSTRSPCATRSSSAARTAGSMTNLDVLIGFERDPGRRRLRDRGPAARARVPGRAAEPGRRSRPSSTTLPGWTEDITRRAPLRGPARAPRARYVEWVEERGRRADRDAVGRPGARAGDPARAALLELPVALTHAARPSRSTAPTSAARSPSTSRSSWTATAAGPRSAACAASSATARASTRCARSRPSARAWACASLTLYAFSVENWKRPRAEVRYLMRLLRRFLVEERPTLMENGVRLRAIGRLDDLPGDALRGAARDRGADRATNAGMLLRLALSYGSRTEIADALRAPGRATSRAGRSTRRRSTRRRCARYLYDPDDARSRPADPHGGRDAHLELPPVADLLRRDLRVRRVLAGVPRGASSRPRCATTRGACASSAA